jgi:hypothetical protein
MSWVMTLVGTSASNKLRLASVGQLSGRAGWWSAKPSWAG